MASQSAKYIMWTAAACIALVPYALGALVPDAFFELVPNSTVISPDRSLLVEQFSKESIGHLNYEFCVFDSLRKKGQLLNEKEIVYYPAKFFFTPNSQWLLRTQKIDTSLTTLFVYKRAGAEFVQVEGKPLGNLAWEYFLSLAESKGVSCPANHMSATLVAGLDDNYAWFNKTWPDSRYLMISIAGDSGNRIQPYVDGWRCVYDILIGEFFVPREFLARNARAIHFPLKDAGR